MCVQFHDNPSNNCSYILLKTHANLTVAVNEKSPKSFGLILGEHQNVVTTHLRFGSRIHLRGTTIVFANILWQFKFFFLSRSAILDHFNRNTMHIGKHVRLYTVQFLLNLMSQKQFCYMTDQG